ncbi:MAG: response regulator [Planctomycetes bacterium]|nr:response regulator [Planctomycetota bacterium]
MCCVLLIDDREDSMKALGTPLVSSGHQVIHAQSIPTAFLLLQEHRPGLVFVNLVMRDLQGLEAICRLASSLPSLIFHTPSGEWPFRLPLRGDRMAVFKTGDLIFYLEEALSGALGGIRPLQAAHLE